MKISPDAVTEALEGLRKAEPIPGNPLLDLETVRQRLRAHGIAPDDRSATWCLFSSLSDLVAMRLAYCRGISADALCEDLRSDEARSALEEDFSAASIEREAWSCLFHRYTQQDPLRVNELVAFTGFSPSHIRRRRIHGFKLLADALLEEESRSRRSSGMEQPDAATDSAAGDEAADFDTSGNLSRPRVSMIGREPAAAMLRDALLGDARLVTLSGTGGSGKTHLALHVASDLRSSFANGVWLVSLVAVESPALIAAEVARVLGVGEEASDLLTKSLRDRIGSRSMLVVFDNCEHLLDGCATLIDDLLRRCPNLRVLTTSREPLGLSGERVHPVPPLKTPDRRERDIDRIGAAPSVQLFLRRARVARPGFEIVEDNATQVARLCRRLDGLPLALELAAARMSVLTEAQILQRLDAQMELLIARRRDGPLHHQTMRAAIDWSLELLGRRERRLLARLSVFRGAMHMEAIQSVCNVEAMTESSLFGQVSELVTKSMLQAVQREGVMVYTMLETIRQHAAERLEGRGEVDRLRLRHCRWFHDRLTAGGRDLERAGSEDGLGSIHQELDDLRAALRWCCEHPDLDPEAVEPAGGGEGSQAIPGPIEMGLAMATSMQLYWTTRGDPSEGRQWLGRLLALPMAVSEHPARAAALAAAGALGRQQGDYEDAQGMLEESLSISLALDDRHQAAVTQRNLGSLADELGDYERARTHYEQSVSIMRELEDEWGMAAGLNNLGILDLHTGRFEEARTKLHDSLRRFQDLADRWAVGTVWNNLGETSLAERDLDLAERQFEQSLGISRELSDKPGISTALRGMGKVHRMKRQLDVAGRYLREAGDLLSEFADRQAVAEWFEEVALLLADEERWELAAKALAAAERLRERIHAVIAPKDREELAALGQQLGEQLGSARLEMLRLGAREVRWREQMASALLELA